MDAISLPTLHFKFWAFAVVETEEEMLSHPPTNSLESLCLCLGIGTICFALEEHLNIEKCQPRFLSARIDAITGRQSVLDVNHAAMMP